jgi:hypothetical protein
MYPRIKGDENQINERGHFILEVSTRKGYDPLGGSNGR